MIGQGRAVLTRCIRPKCILRLVGILVGILVFWGLVTSLTIVIALDHMTITQLFPEIATVICVIGAIVVVVLSLITKRPRRPINKRRQLTRREKFFLAVAFIVLTGFSTGSWFQQSRADSLLLEKSNSHFTVSTNGTIPRNQVEQTRIELARAIIGMYRYFANEPKTSEIHVELYPDRASLIQAKNMPEWTGGATRCDEKGSVMYIPAEKARNWMHGTSPTTTPPHEAVHAVMCQVLGWEAFHRIPAWFHEGVAQYESLRGTSRLLDRDLVRLYLWMNRTEILTSKEFCSFSPRQSELSAGVFYATSYEFFRYIATAKGPQIVTRITEEVKSGKSFDDALLNLLGNSCELLYSDWLIKSQF